MAESVRTSKDNNDKRRKRPKSRDKGEMNEPKTLDEAQAEAIPECAVCLQICVHPAKLPCSHIFCFLCLKGLATQSRRCAMCRQDIPSDYLDHPQLLEIPIQAEKEAFEDGYQWFYEGRSGWWQYEERISAELETYFKLGHKCCEILICGSLYVVDFVNGQQFRKDHQGRKRKIKRDLASAPKKGWWQYDERTSRELEAAYKSGQRTCELLIVGQLYIADFDAMLQLRRNDMSRRRRIKRDLASIPKKGIAGLRLDGSPNSFADDEDIVAVPSTSQQPDPSRLEAGVNLSQESSSESTDFTFVHDTWQNDRSEGADLLLSNNYRNVEEEDDSDEGQPIVQHEERSSEEREFTGDENEVNIGDSSHLDQANLEANLEAQLRDLCLH